jgi:hypothetical protein
VSGLMRLLKVMFCACAEQHKVSRASNANTALNVRVLMEKPDRRFPALAALWLIFSFPFEFI